MPRPADPVQHIMHLLAANHQPRTVKLHAATLWDMTESEAEETILSAKHVFGCEAERMDILGEYMLNYQCQGTVIEQMSRTLKESPQNAHFYNTLRNCIKDRLHTLERMHDCRQKEGRNEFKTKGQEQQEATEVVRKTALHFATAESHRRHGYSYCSSMNTVQPGVHLSALDVAIRDIIRLRMLPKSPKEDDILAEMSHSLSEEEEKLRIDRKKLDDRECQTDIRILDPHEFDADQEALRTSITHREQSILAQRLFIERLRAYNETWQKAEERVKGIMEALGIKLGFRHETVGLPDVVQQAVSGDEQAIAELKQVVANHLKLKEQNQGRERKKEFAEFFAEGFLSKAATLVCVFVVAFTCMWTCLNLVIGPRSQALPGNALHARLLPGTTVSDSAYQPAALAREALAAAQRTFHDGATSLASAAGVLAWQAAN